MTTVYDIEAELRLRDLMSHALLGIGSHFTRLERNIKAAQLNINELSGAFKALGVVVAGGAIFKGLEVLTKHGLRLEHFKRNLRQQATRPIRSRKPCRPPGRDRQQPQHRRRR